MKEQDIVTGMLDELSSRYGWEIPKEGVVIYDSWKPLNKKPKFVKIKRTKK